MPGPDWSSLYYPEARRGVDEAIARVASAMPAWRRRLFLRRANRYLAKLFPPTPGAGGGNGFGDETGVREPRRPHPTRPSSAMALPMEDSPAP